MDETNPKQNKVKRKEEVNEEKNNKDNTGLKKPLGEKEKELHDTYEWKVRKSDIPLFNLGAQIKQGSGLAIAGFVLNIDSSAKTAMLNKLKQMVQHTMRKQDLDGLAEVCVSVNSDTNSLLSATSNLIQLCGLGTLRPNTIMINFPQVTDRQNYAMFKRVLEEAVAYEMAVIIPVGGVRIWDGVHGSKEKATLTLVSPYIHGYSRSANYSIEHFTISVLLNQNDTGFLLMTAYLIHNHPM